MCGIRKPEQTPATHELSLVMRLGQRFESARRLSIFPAKLVKTKSPRHEHRGLCQQYVSSRLLSQSLVHTVGGMPSHVGYPVRVAVKGHGYAGAPKQVLD